MSNVAYNTKRVSTPSSVPFCGSGEADESSSAHIASVLRDADYEVSADIQGGTKAVLAFDPNTIILGANPPQTDCSDLLSEINHSESTTHNRLADESREGMRDADEDQTANQQSVTGVDDERRTLRIGGSAILAFRRSILSNISARISGADL
jgi:hypothetical protein